MTTIINNKLNNNKFNLFFITFKDLLNINIYNNFKLTFKNIKLQK